MDFADRLKEEINILGFNYKTFGEAVNIPENSISEWCSERAQPNLNNLIKLADYFNCSIDYLVGEEPTKYEGVIYKKCPPFSEQIRKVFKDINKTHFCKATNIGRSRIYHWLDGVSVPQLDNLIKLANYFKTTIDILIGRQ